jgi:tetratricopeptide (TPR) repeat protein
MEILGFLIAILTIATFGLSILSIFRPELGGFWLTFLKTKKRLNVIGLNLLATLSFIIISVFLVPIDNYERGNESLNAKNFVEAKEYFEKIDTQNVHYKEKEQLLQKLRDEAKIYYKDKIDSSILDLDYSLSEKFNKEYYIIIGETMYDADDLQKIIRRNADILKNQIPQYENQGNFAKVKEYAEKLLKVDEYKSYAAEVLEKNKVKIDLTSVTLIRSNVDNLVSKGLVKEAGAELDKLSEYPDQKEYIAKKKQELKENLLKIGQSVKTENWEVTLLSVNQVNSISSERPAEGGVFIIIKIKYKNISKVPQSDEPKIELFDPARTEIDKAFGADVAYSIVSGDTSKTLSDVNPGITVTKSAVYEIARELWKEKGWKVVIDADAPVNYLAN